MASFTTQIKDEITKIETERCESLAEVCAYIYYSTELNDNISLYIENASVARRMFNLIKRLYGVNINLTIRTQKKFVIKKIYILTISHKLDIIKSDVLNNYNSILNFSDEEKASYLKGIFLSTGSINDPSKSKYHLEFLVDDYDKAIKANELLKDFNFNSKLLKREKGYMVYIKSSEEISDFIKLIGATQALFYYEDIRIYRDHKNMVNRLNNCEQANVEKSMRTCNIQLENIEYLKKYDLLTLISDQTKIVVDYRIKYPEVTMNELAEIISMETDYKITKSGINHHFRKIQKLVDNHKKNS